MTSIYDRLSEERKKLQEQDLAPAFWSTGGYQLFKEKYLYQAANPREQYERIARTLAVHTPDPQKWYGKFFDIMWKGWLSPSTPILANTGTTRGLPVSCLTGDSLLNTRVGGVKPIEDIQVGDEVLTHKGRWKKVVAKQSRKTQNDLFELKVDTRNTPIRITGNHPVLTNVGWVRVDELNPLDHFIATNGTIEYEAKPFTMSLYESKPREEYHSQTKLPENVEVTPELAWAIGLWFAEGSLCRIDGTHGRTVRVTMAEHEEEIAKKFGEIMAKYFNVNFSFYSSEFEGRKWVNCNVHSTVLAEYFGEKFGTSCLTKTIPVGLLEMPKENLRELLRGIYDGDGRKSSGNGKLSTPDIRLSNKNLISQVYEICLKLGEKVSYTVNLKDKRNTRNPYGCITFHKGAVGAQSKKRNVFRGVKFHDGNRYCKFELTKLNEEEVVYDITVEDDHSFSVCGVVVHNCAGSYFPDSIDGIYKAKHETAMLTKYGFGTAGYLGDIRPRGSKISVGGKSLGILPIIQGVQHDMEYVAQGTARRGSWAGYVPVDHGDFDEVCSYLEQHPDGNNIGWVWKDSDTEKMNAGDPEAIRRFQKMLKTKMVTGKGYMSFIDKQNRARPQWYKDHGLDIKAPQLCNEVMLHSSEDYTYTCVLASMNLLFWDDWKDTDAVFTATVFLDAVAQEFIEKAKNISGLEKAVAFTKKSRALGLGAMGLHSLYQSKMLPFGSLEAYFLNTEIFSHIREEAEKATKWIAEHYGEPEWCKGYGRANTHLLAIAPTKSTSLIMSGVSEGINPDTAMVFTQRSAGGEIDRVNPFLLKLMKERGVYNKATVERIRLAMGSVQNESWLTPEEKLVFLTAFEMNQMDILNQAVDRGAYLDQWQSLNLFFAAEEDEEVIARIHQHAIEEEGILGLYYVYSRAGVQASNGECLACQ